MFSFYKNVAKLLINSQIKLYLHTFSLKMRKYHRFIHSIRQLAVVSLTGLMVSCAMTKYVPDGEYMLDKVGVECENERVDVATLSSYVRQNPNAKWFNLVKVPLGIYSLAGRDTSKWINRALQRIGEAPVLYDRTMTERSKQEISMALQNMGYLGATVDAKETFKKSKVRLTYKLNTGDVYRVKSLTLDVKDTAIARHIGSISGRTLLREGMVLNINRLDNERKRLTDYLQNRGYYKFVKDFITYTADTVSGDKQVALTMHVNQYGDENDQLVDHPIYRIGDVNVITEFDIANISPERLANFNRTEYRDMAYYYKKSLPLRPRIFAENCFIEEGELYNAFRLQRTYTSMARLGALKYSNIHFVERTKATDAPSKEKTLDVFILTEPASLQSFSAELEGTNTVGDLGAAASLTYQHQNLFRGSETFSFKVRGAYEAISGLQGYSTDNYKEYGVEMSLNFPRFMFPFLSSDFKRRIRASSEVSVRYNTQERPEFSRRVASASWSYRWSQRQRINHKIDLLDVNYVYMPSISPTFRDEYLNNVAANSILKYNYEDLFIARLGYGYSYTSATGAGGTVDPNKTSFSIRTNIESAGNLLRLISNTIYERKTANGQYALGNIAYAQYVKGDFDYTHHFVIDYRNTIAFHFGFGIAYPYGNSTILPFEKRYFSGGANSVRGWSVRSLGPGSYAGKDKHIDFINQSGDLKIDLSLEYRTFMFWKLNGAIFVDAGNIWTLRSYAEQPGGQFRFNTFLKQMAVAYGLGLRLNLDYFILRFDGGMKAINPAFPTSSKEHYPILHPNFDRDFTFHFAVGYPF